MTNILYLRTNLDDKTHKCSETSDMLRNECHLLLMVDLRSAPPSAISLFGHSQRLSVLVWIKTAMLSALVCLRSPYTTEQSVSRGNKPRSHQRCLLIYPFRLCVVSVRCRASPKWQKTVGMGRALQPLAVDSGFVGSNDA